MRNRPRKSSTRVTLVLLGAVALAGCGDSEPDGAARQKQYASTEDCLADWGDPKDCEERKDQQRDGSLRRVYVGGGGSGSGAWRGGTSSSGEHAGGGTSRGGFGSSGRAHGSSAS